MPFVRVVEGTVSEKRKTAVMASLYLVSSGLADSWCLLRSNHLTISSTGEKNLSNQGNMTSITCCCVDVNFETFQVNIDCSRNRFKAITKLSRMNVGWKNSSLTPEKQQSLQSNLNV